MINRFVSFVNFHNRFDKALTKKACNAGPYSELSFSNLQNFKIIVAYLWQTQKLVRD